MVSLAPAPVRVLALAIAISALSFAAGMAGDLSAPPPVSGARIVVAIPPTPRAAYAPQAAPLLATRTARALTVRPVRVAYAPRRQTNRAFAAPVQIVAAPKSERAWARPPDPKPAFAELGKQDFVKA